MDEDSRHIRTSPYIQNTQKNKNDSKLIDQELYHSNSANDLLDLKENKKKTKTKSDSTQKKKNFPRTRSANTYFDHYDINNCEYCYGIDDMLEEDKSKLSSFIENNPTFLKLFGNKRYNKKSPFLFVEDHKNRIDDDRIGLLPIPSKPKVIMKSKEENNNLYEMQRKIVMMRRYQYGKKNLRGAYLNEDGEDFFEKINKIQLWWKKMNKIITIQKVFRGYRIRNKVDFILNFMDIINKWQNILDKIMARRALRDLINKVPKKIPKNKFKSNDYISKVRRNGNKTNEENGNN